MVNHKKIILHVKSEEFDLAVSSIKETFSVLDTKYRSSGDREFWVNKSRYGKKARFTEEQADEIIKMYRRFLKEKDSGKKARWSHVAEGAKVGLSKRQVLSILKASGVYRVELHKVVRKESNNEKAK